MNNKGITLVTVVVMIIVIIIIATVSILSGTRLITNSKKLSESEILESVRSAVQRKNAEIEMQGTITPIDENYPGQLSPIITPDSLECTNWYLLNDDNLEELGIKYSEGKFLVNYPKGIVISLADTDYAEKYLIYRFMDEVKAKKESEEIDEYEGTKLVNPSSSSDGRTYYREHEYEAREVFGNGWYRVNPTQIKNHLESVFEGKNLDNYIKNDYLVNYDNYKMEKFTSEFIGE
ncbi:MAG: hypothetical protein IKI57_00570 [Clostridia bacterium]|nr:hypothetical protein [Clostridia bacterium]